MTCYKCKTDKDLSLKRRLKSGNKLFICRPCRRQAARNFTPCIKSEWDGRDEWNIKAYKIIADIEKKYAVSSV